MAYIREISFGPQIRWLHRAWPETNNVPSHFTQVSVR